MSIDAGSLKKLNNAIDEFEQAVKKHEHVGMLDHEVALRENLDRARQRLREIVVGLVEETG